MPAEQSSGSLARYIPLLVLIVAAGCVLTALGPLAWLVLLTDGLLVLGLLAAAAGWGAWPAMWLRPGRRPALQQVCLATALGLGLLGTLTLVLGVLALLTQVVAWAALAVGWGFGLARLHVAGKQPTPTANNSRNHSTSLVITGLLLLTLALPLGIMLFGATLPPGVLWDGEARGYDVLEYHLQAPREYFDAGRITFLPHNVYASFPQQMEMLYLLLMHLRGEPLSAAIPAQLLHAACGIVAVLALVAWTPAGWPRRVVAIVAGSVPWLAYLGCLAYVENGMLLFAAVAAGLVLDHVRSTGPVRDWRTALAAGLCAGLAGGCKYTALVFVATALFMAWLCAMRGNAAARTKKLALFGTGVVVAFSPWLIRNVAFTGNPVYPFAYEWFGGQAWSTEQAEQWTQGHSLPPDQAALVGRMGVAVRELFASRMLGPALVILALVGGVLTRSRAAVLLGVWFTVIIAGWATFTHMPGRFALPAVVPLALLAGGWNNAGGAGRKWWGGFMVLIMVVAAGGAVANAVTLAQHYRAHNGWWTRIECPLAVLPGGTVAMAQTHGLNAVLPPDANVWLVGESRAFYLRFHVHYTVVFSRDPWLAYARDHAAPDVVAWLRTQNVSHVVFSWGEIDRLRATYGFPAFVTRDWARTLAAESGSGLRPLPPPQRVELGDVSVYEVVPE